MIYPAAAAIIAAEETIIITVRAFPFLPPSPASSVPDNIPSDEVIRAALSLYPPDSDDMSAVDGAVDKISVCVAITEDAILSVLLTDVTDDVKSVGSDVEAAEETADSARVSFSVGAAVLFTVVAGTDAVPV